MRPTGLPGRWPRTYRGGSTPSETRGRGGVTSSAVWPGLNSAFTSPLAFTSPSAFTTIQPSPTFSFHQHLSFTSLHQPLGLTGLQPSPAFSLHQPLVFTSLHQLSAFTSLQPSPAFSLQQPFPAFASIYAPLFCASPSISPSGFFLHSWDPLPSPADWADGMGEQVVGGHPSMRAK